MRNAIVAALVLASAGLAAAETKIMVLQSEGRTDANTRKKVDAAIIKLAKTGPDPVTPSEITYTDAAAMVGCKPEDASCKDEVLGTLAVDEIIITTITPKPGGLEVNVKRVAKGGATRDATTVVPADKPDKLDAIAPLFGGKAVATTTPPPPTEPPPVIGPTPPPTTPPPVTEPKPQDKLPELKPEDKKPITDPVKPLPEPVGSTDDRRVRNRRRLVIGGMAGGGGLVLLGFILWGSASSVQGDIDNFQVRSASDLVELRALEDKGDSRARWGNLFFVSGLVAAGVSTYFYVKQRRAAKATTTALVPTVFDHGAGLTLSFGGSR